MEAGLLHELLLHSGNITYSCRNPSFHGSGVYYYNGSSFRLRHTCVAILVFMEAGLLLSFIIDDTNFFVVVAILVFMEAGLLLAVTIIFKKLQKLVAILVFMEAGLLRNALWTGGTNAINHVAILVFMEAGLLHFVLKVI